VTIIDGSKVILYAPEMDKPQESLLIDDVKMQALFSAFMSTKRMREHYDVMVTESSHKRVTVVLLPRTQAVRQNFRELRITLSPRTWLPVSICEYKLNNQRITFTFEQPQVNRTIPADMFSVKSLDKLFKKPAGKETKKTRAGQ
jgi:outer membrane lipoprotein-sorting protein